MTLLVVALALGLAASWLTAATVFPIWSRLATVRPSLARRSSLVAALPLLAGATLVLASFLPGDPHLDTLLGCHCAISAPGWLHLCPLHPERSVGLLLPALAVLALLLSGRIRALATLATEPRGQGGTSFLDLPRPAILLHGWLRPTLAVDRRLWAALSPTDRAAVLAHEHAHVARRDPLVLMVLRLLVSLGPAVAGRALVRGWLDHAERMADARAADAIGDPVPVAEALVRCARLSAPRRLALGWTGGRLEARVHAQVLAAALMASALGLLFTGRHEHAHAHPAQVHTHAHRHDDGHHDHTHPELPPEAWHTHEHRHEPVVHRHPHVPDLHHRHVHPGSEA